MKIYSLYEFPPDLASLSKLISIVDAIQPLSKDTMREIVSDIFGKRSSRTEILIKDLKKIGIIEGNDLMTLSWESQLYVDLRADLRRLLVHNVYKINELFYICKLICDIDPTLELSNQNLYKLLLLNCSLDVENKRTVSEKLYAIKRLVRLCQNSEEVNPFKAHEVYIGFLRNLQKKYIEEAEGYAKNVIIKNLESAMCISGYTKAEFNRFMTMLYTDPIYATYTSFSIVNKEFAEKGYITLEDKDFYYIKIKNKLF
ncbi:hypothetical protein [Bacillus cereus]|uniref:hypothetical protein n=1 Tax=Bacillus cereus TaxID=1396 RepID=UPI00124DCE44|nr:hypothetical protein [Bacillus cereus]KAB2481421.1 hypothetical protein F8159_08530 [Bacillus cereus]